MKTQDGRELQIDLLAVFGRFRSVCGGIVAHEEEIKQQKERLANHQTVRIELPDEFFEKQLESLNWQLREWWKDYKRDWRSTGQLEPRKRAISEEIASCQNYRVLQRLNVFGLPALRPFGDIELHCLPFLQALEAARLDS